MSEQHTPGPWTVETTEGDRPLLQPEIHAPDSDEVVAVIGVGAVLWGHEQIANARLVAAAPDMLETLEKIRNITDGHPIDADRRDRINELCRAALAKAQGQSDAPDR